MPFSEYLHMQQSNLNILGIQKQVHLIQLITVHPRSTQTYFLFKYSVQKQSECMLLINSKVHNKTKH